MAKGHKEKSIGIPRNSSIELLRILSMIGVVILHYNNSSAGAAFKFVKEGSINQFYLYFTENMFVCAVNLFILSSAYFLAIKNQRKFVKIMELIIQVIAFNVVFYMVGVAGGGVFSPSKGCYHVCCLQIIL